MRRASLCVKAGRQARGLSRCEAAAFRLKPTQTISKLLQGARMADDHSVATASDVMDMPAHEEMYADFLALTEISVVSLLCIILILVLWGLKGDGGVALIGFFLTLAAAAFGGLSGLTWRAVLPVFVLLGIACIIL
jgi:hypothetical protein